MNYLEQYAALIEKGSYGLMTDGCLITDLTLGLSKTYTYKQLETV